MVSRKASYRVKRMKGGGFDGGAANTSGGIYISNSSFIFLIIVVIAAIAFFIYAFRTQPQPHIIYRNIEERPERPERPERQYPPIIVNTKGGDDRYSMAPKPERVYYNGPDLDYPRAAIPIGIPTRGLPDAYQAMGLLKGDDGKMTPLYGRRTAGSSDRYNYYTRTDTYNPVPVPLIRGRRDCQDDTGCEEVFDGDELKVGPTGEKVKATLYKMSNIFL